MPSIDDVCPAHTEKVRSFLAHPVIAKLKDQRQWAVTDMRDKKPLNMHEFFSTGELWPLSMHNRDAFLTLPEILDGYRNLHDTLSEVNPNAAATITYPVNFALFLNQDTSSVCIVDIEPACPDELKAQFLDTPFIYGEVSMSGKGYHLIYPVPGSLMRKYKETAQRSVVKEPHKYYEVHFEHWVTFTMNQVVPPDSPAHTLEAIIEPVFAETDIAVAKSHVEAAEEVPDTLDALAEQFLPTMLEVARRIPYNVNDNTDDDLSRRDFCVCLWLARKLAPVVRMKVQSNQCHELTDNEIVHLLAAIAEEILPYRDKWETIRNNMPWVTYNCYRAFQSAKGDTVWK